MAHEGNELLDVTAAILEVAAGRQVCLAWEPRLGERDRVDQILSMLPREKRAKWLRAAQLLEHDDKEDQHVEGPGQPAVPG